MYRTHAGEVEVLNVPYIRIAVVISIIIIVIIIVIFTIIHVICRRGRRVFQV